MQRISDRIKYSSDTAAILREQVVLRATVPGSDSWYPISSLKLLQQRVSIASRSSREEKYQAPEFDKS